MDEGLAESAFKDLALGAVDADDRILFDSDGGELFWDADGSGAAEAGLFAQLAEGLDPLTQDPLPVQ